MVNYKCEDGDIMAKTSQAKLDATRRYNLTKSGRIELTVTPVERKQEIKDYAESRGESLMGFINRAISETMERDKEEKN
jgi:hypothetical protein